MNFIKKIDYFIEHIGYEKLFIAFFTMLVAFASAFEMFKVDVKSGLNMILALICLNISVNIFDDFMDWVSGQTNKRHELEQLGIRGNYSKCAHFYNDKKSPRLYLFAGILFFIIFLLMLYKIVMPAHKYIVLLILPLLFISGLVIYSDYGKNITKYTGYEFFATIPVAPTSMLIIFYTMSNHLTLKICYISLIFFFFILYLLFVSALLNYKQDKMIEKNTLPTIFDNSNFKIYFSFFLIILPYLLVYAGIFFKILSNKYYIIFLALPFSLWHFSLMYMLEKVPQKVISWHVLMGIDNTKTENEQNNLSWYYIRYNFARNIFIFITFLFMICIINFNDILAF